MTLDDIRELLPTLTSLVFLIGMIFFLISVRFFKRSRRAPYWAERRRAGQRGLRIFLFSTALITISMVLCLATLIVSLIGDQLEENLLDEEAGEDREAVVASETPSIPTTTDVPFSEATLTPTPTLTPTLSETSPEIIETTALSLTQTASATPSITPEVTEALSAAETIEPTSEPTLEPTEIALAQVTETPSLTFTPTITVSPSPSPTESATPTPTSSPTLTLTLTATITFTPTPSPTLTPTSTMSAALINATLPSAWTAPLLDAELDIVTVSDTLNSAVPRTQLRNGIVRVFFFVDYQNIAAGTLWRRELYKDGTYIVGRSDLWGIPSEGSAYFFFSLAGGFTSGDYEIRLYLGENSEPLDTITFRVTG
jgi:hypothetical protein